jgi:hypothetical protein
MAIVVAQVPVVAILFLSKAWKRWDKLKAGLFTFMLEVVCVAISLALWELISR